MLAFIGFLVIVAYLIRYFVAVEEFKFVVISYFWDTVISIGIFIGILELIRWMHLYLNKVMPFQKGEVVRIGVQIVLSVGVVLGLRWVMLWIAETYFGLNMSATFRFFAFVLDVMAICLMNAVFIGEYFLDQWRAAQVEAEQLKKESIQAQFEALKGQVNPHFLFNSFTTLNELIFEDPDRASHYLEQLSSVYRYILKNNEVNQVTVGKELEFLKSYIHLLEIRYGNNFRMEIDLSEAHRATKLPPITLQILLENAVKHNIVSKEKPLTVSIFSRDDMLWVQNNYQPRDARETLRKMGLQHIQNRYKLLNEETVEVIKGPENWIVKLPMHYS